MDLEKFEQFRRKFDPSFANKTGGSQGGQSKHQIKWPSNSGQGGNKPASNDDDLYN
jgi:hypothetical protein